MSGIPQLEDAEMETKVVVVCASLKRFEEKNRQ